MGDQPESQRSVITQPMGRRDLPPAARPARRRNVKDDEEKPFWISFADLMTALMVLFLVALSAELNEVSKQRAIAGEQRDQAVRTQKELEQERGRLEVLVAEIARRETDRDSRRDQRAAQIERLLDEIGAAVRRQEGVQFDRVRAVIDFGGGALFRHGRHDLTIEQANTIRRLVPALLAIKRSEAGERWLKQIVAEGFADQTGAYLYNLNLSLQRSQRVLCVLLADAWTQPPGATATASAQAAGWQPLTAGQTQAQIQAQPQPQPQPALLPISADDHALIKRLFLVGGYSSNSAKASLDESRRIELRVEFYHLDETVEQKEPPVLDTGRCALGG